MLSQLKLIGGVDAGEIPTLSKQSQQRRHADHLVECHLWKLASAALL